MASCVFADPYAWTDDACFPGQQKLADDMGSGERSVRTYLKELEDAGFLEVTGMQMHQNARSPGKILPPMELLMDVPQALVGDVGVDLGGRHVLVAQKLLDAPEIGAVGQKVGGEGMAQGVGRHLLGQPGQARVFPD